MKKQLILARKDLEMPIGKLSAQVAHASLMSFIDAYRKSAPIAMEWLDNSYTKVVLRVKNENQLLKYRSIAEENNIPCALVTDEGRTCFNGQPTVTCLGIGPYESEVLDQLFRRLQLYR